jgi:hypothetical protein
MNRLIVFGLLILISLGSCTDKTEARKAKSQVTNEGTFTTMQDKLDDYVSVKLTTDLSKLTENEKKILPLLIRAADIMNNLYWEQAYGNKADLLASITDEEVKKFVNINYGPWDRMNDNQSFVEGIGIKPLGANFYPIDMTKEEFEKADLKDKKSQYTFLRRDQNGKLVTIPYNQHFKAQLAEVASYLLEAARITDDLSFKNYLEQRANALLTDQFDASDRTWLDMKTNHLDIVIGPIENYEDALFNYKTSYEGYVLVKDMAWSEKLAKYAAFLTQLQKALPVDPKYKAEKPGSDSSDLNAYDIVYYAGDCNAGGKTIAINLPNDEAIQLEKGARRLQLKNAMKAKYDEIMVPIAAELIDPSQRKYVTFDAFFANTMFHEVAHGLGIKNTVNGKGKVRDALLEHHSALEEGKADILGIYMVQQLHKRGEITGDIKEYMTTFMAGIFRSVRFGASSAHGTANMIRFNYFKEKGAFARNSNGTYTLNYEKMDVAISELTQLILTLQGNGDYVGVSQLVKEKGIIHSELQSDLNRLKDVNIPVDVIFEQGIQVLGL